MISAASINVVHNEARFRFEARIGDAQAWLEYIRAHKKLVIAHTEVPQALQGKGVGAALVKAALTYAEERHLLVIPICPFARAYLQRHPAYHHLLEG